MSISLEQISAFVATVDNGSFSAAARKLGKVQSVISTAVANLEADLDLQLFDRSGRYPVLTADGEAMLARARRVLIESDRLVAHASELHDTLEPRLTIAIESMVMTNSLARVFRQLQQSFPLLEIEILSAGADRILRLLESGRAQLAISGQRMLPPPEFAFVNYSSVPLCLVCGASHPMSSMNSFSLDTYASHTQIIVTSGDVPVYFRGNYSDRLADTVWLTENAPSALMLAKAGVGWVALPEHMVREGIKSGELVELPFDAEPGAWIQAIDIIWLRSQPLGKGARTLVAYLTDKTRK